MRFGRPPRTVHVLWFSLLASPLAACGDDKGTGPATNPTAGEVTGDVANEVSVGETFTFETSATSPPDGEVSLPTADFGEPCQGNTDCESGWCVEGPNGYICTVDCLAECPAAYDCKGVQNSGGDVIFLCLPRVQKVCVPCLQDFQCNGGACMNIDGARECASACLTDEECPDGYACGEDASAEHSGKFCQPKSGSCSCSPPYAGVARSCTKTNATGTCVGVETCDPEVGWVGCNAREATTESCNYIDDDCDNDIDEDMKTDGIYARADQCGSCSTDCSVILPNASATSCQVAGGAAQCIVIACEPGFTQLNPYVCVPDSGSVCQPCDTAAQCLGADAACVTLDDGKFCSRGCAQNEDCSVGFECKTVPESATKQCVPTSGSCSCDGSNTNLSRACTETYTPPDPNQPSVTCKGLEHCTAQGWGGCELPGEVCDGIDNDCDGTIDDPFKTGDKYTDVSNCGACGVSCLAVVRPHAQPSCDASGPVPMCAFACVGGAVDVNGLSDDGCECTPVAGPDLAGDSVDSNCDGIDGEVGNGIFVSKEGLDTNPGTIELPVQKLSVGLTKAHDGGKRDVYVATGVYAENIILQDKVGVFGGYAPFFDEHDVLLYETAIVGSVPDATHPGTVTATALGTAATGAVTVFDGFTVFGVNAANLEGTNSYAIYLKDCGALMRVSNNRVYGGPGGRGGSGTRGTDGAVGPAGGNGAGAHDAGASGQTPACTATDVGAGGAGGSRMCGTTDVSGGKGGNAECPAFGDPPVAANAGANGKGTSAGTGGAAGYDLCISAMAGGCGGASVGCKTCYAPADNARFSGAAGTPGAAGVSGTAGTGCTGATGTVVSGHWKGNAGGAGAAGTNGAGGGGGGAGGGVELDGTSCFNPAVSHDVGGSGGGGGAGGCGATGGGGGTPGGGSFGIFVVNTTAALPAVKGNTIKGGLGGTGGDGGPAGVAGTGGAGALGGVSGDTLSDDAVWCAAGGGEGADGGQGGHGGGGGGACGGASYGIYVSAPGGGPALWKTDNGFTAGATGGTKGRGGVSLDQTKNGKDGAAGTAANTNF